MQVSLTGVSLHVKDVQKAKEFYLRIPGASLVHERGDFFVSIRIGGGRVNLVRVNREEKFHLEFGSDDLDSLRAKLDEAGIQEQGPQPSQWGQTGLITRDSEGNFIEFDEHLGD